MNKYFSIVQCGAAEDLHARAKWFDSHPEEVDRWLKLEPSNLEMLADSTNSCLWPLVLHHFGFVGEAEPAVWCDRACQLTADFFSQPSKQILDHSKNLEWYRSFIELLLMSSLSELGENARIAFSCFLQPDFKVEQRAIPINPTLGDVALLVAGDLGGTVRSKPLENRISRSRKKRPKQLWTAWNAIRESDLDGFRDAISKSVASFISIEACEDSPPTAIATFESALVGIAFKNGWTEIVFPDEISARLVTHQSLGFVQ